MEVKSNNEAEVKNSGIDIAGKGSKARLERATLERATQVRENKINYKKRRMFKGVLILGVALMVVIFLYTMLFGKNSAMGTWELYSIEQAGIIIEGEDLEAQYGGKVLYNLNRDGTLVIIQLGQEIEATWSEEGEEVYFHYSSGVKELIRDQDTMTLEQNGATYIFTK